MVLKLIAQHILLWLMLPETAWLIGEPFYWLLGRRSKRNEVNFIKAKRILIVLLGEIGDVVLATPFLRELRRNLPHSWITLVVKRKIYNLVEFCPYVTEILIYNGELRNSSQLEKVMRRMRTVLFAFVHLVKRKFDIAIIPRRFFDFYDGLYLGYFSGAKKTIAYIKDTISFKDQLSHSYEKLFTHLIKEETLKHEVEHNLDIIKFLKGTVNDDSLELWINREDEDYIQGLLQKYNITEDSLLIGIGAGSRIPQKVWPIERFLGLIKWLLEELNSTIMLLGDKNEINLGSYIEETLKKDYFGKTINLMGKTTLRQVVASLKYCKLYIGNDTGLIHLAAAVKVPIIEISSWSKTGSPRSHFSSYYFFPWKTRYVIVNPEKQTYPCKEQCTFKTPHCILKVTLGDVKKAVKKLLSL